MTDGPPSSDWAGLDSPLARHLENECRHCLEAYRANPKLILEHANIERDISQGGYGRRQIYELVQNGADALLGFPDGRIEVVLTPTALYCANEGDPIDADGVDTILAAHLSAKRGNEIGRFGLGFKSVLGVSDAPQFYSRSGSFRFSPQHSEHYIRLIKPDAERIPILRLAGPIDPQKSRADRVLDGLMEWATTVVKLPLRRGLEWLKADMDSFPAEFLLFSPHVGTLVLTDRLDVDESWSLSEAKQRQRVIRQRQARHDGDYAHVFVEEKGTDGKEKTSEWKVFRTTHRPSAEARKDGGELSDREELPISWAVPLRERNERAKFWAFFPTEEFITLSGVLNAPWKMNSDRQNVLNSRFNEELLLAAATLIVENLPHLVQEDDPGRYLELFPSLNDNPCWGDIELQRHVYRLLSQTRCLLDQNKQLRPAHELKWHPRIPREALDIWANCPKCPSDWIHPSYELQHRRARVEHLMRMCGVPAQPFEAWLEALVWDKSLEASAQALRAAAAAVKADAKIKPSLETARILKTADGSLVAPRPGTVFLSRGDGDDVRDGKTHSLILVHPQLAARDDVREALEILGIRQVEATSQLESALENIAKLPPTSLKTFGWPAFWNTVRGVPIETALDMMRERIGAEKYTRIWVRTRGSSFAPIGKVLLPGPVVDGEELRDLDVTVDDTFHAHDMPILKEFGAVDAPQPACSGGTDEFFEEYRKDNLEWYLDELATVSKPQPGYLKFRNTQTTGPLDAYAALRHPKSKALFCQALLKHAVSEERWLLRHDTQRDKYPAKECDPPSLWLVSYYGYLPTSRGPQPIDECFAPDMARWGAVLPVAQCSSPEADALGLVRSLDELDKQKLLRLQKKVEEAIDTHMLAEFYAAAAQKELRFDSIRCRVGDGWEMRPPNEVVIECAVEQVRILERYKAGHLHGTKEQMELLRKAWGLKRTDFKREIAAVPSDEPTPLVDRFPGFLGVESEEIPNLELVPCSTLAEETISRGGSVAAHVDFLRDGNRLYFLDSLPRSEVVSRVVDALEVPLTPEQRAEMLDFQSRIGGKERVQKVRRETGLAAKLLAAVGASALRRRLPLGLLKAEEELHGAPTHERLAELALAVYGVDTLHEFREELAKNGLEPPSQWAGRHAARKWVQMLGFPAEYAGFESAQRAPVEEVEGPPNLPTPHAYQVAMMMAVRLLPTRSEGKRGLLSLPTGAGKTRVAVEALIQAVKEEGLTCNEGSCGPILWIAQSDELCEQAVVTWRYVWRAVGPQRRLVISRLWGANEADAAHDATQVVVATIDKLQGCVGDEGYDWLKRACFVVVDEAHGAITPEYTNALSWLGLTWRDQAGDSDRCPLLGLTATAFRGNEIETTRLVRRFGSYRLDYEEWGENPYPHLQGMGVLARVEHKELTGSNVTLKPEELAELQRLRRLPSSVEERLGSSVSRNDKLMKEIQNLPDEWPVLLFATSVAHAQTMAALLQLEGVSAAAISGLTPPAARRYYIEQFRRGKIRVLTNFNVLTAGFDAPSVRCVIVARPTYSPGLYQQMIGRGLRGPLNGGKEICLIVNVRDNIAQYGGELAFRQFEYLWNPAAAQVRSTPAEAPAPVAPPIVEAKPATPLATANGKAHLTAFHSDAIPTQNVLLRTGDDLFEQADSEAANGKATDDGQAPDAAPSVSLNGVEAAPVIREEVVVAEPAKPDFSFFPSPPGNGDGGALMTVHLFYMDLCRAHPDLKPHLEPVARRQATGYSKSFNNKLWALETITALKKEATAQGASPQSLPQATLKLL
jgi:superfamily II DNA or RNA helicase